MRILIAEARFIDVGNWGHGITNVRKSKERYCPKQTIDDCQQSYNMSGNFEKWAKFTVGFVTNAPTSEATNQNFAIVCNCPGCGGLYWFHISEESIRTLILNCPLWPQADKDKLK